MTTCALKTIDLLRGLLKEEELIQQVSVQEDFIAEDSKGNKDWVPNTTNEVEERDLRRIIQSELKNFPIKEELVLRMRWEHQMKIEIIAKYLDLPLGTIASTLKRGREKLIEAFKRHGYENEI